MNETDAIIARIEELNELRRTAQHGANHARCRTLEAWFGEHFAADQQLAVYGSLAPGRDNHHRLAKLGGVWSAGLTANGHIIATGWGAAMGFPALHWDPLAPPVDVHLLSAPSLPAHWTWLDEFEGDDYVRILVPVYRDGVFVTVANLYEAARTPDLRRDEAG